MSRNRNIAETVSGIERREIDPHDVLAACLEQIRRLEPLLHAWVLVDEAAAWRAVDALAERLARGEPTGPLAGVPIGIKDVIDVAGWPTLAGARPGARRGSQGARRGSPTPPPATADAPFVAALRQAGAILLGKTVTTEFACFDPSPTRNPWAPETHTPGGSSSGSAAAVAAAMCLAAAGTQTGGSLVRPASYCGVAAWKPTFDLFSTAGVVPVSLLLDHVGLIAPSAADLQTLAAALGVPGAPGGEPPQPPRLGVVEAFLEEADEGVRAATLAALDRLRSDGATVEPAPVRLDFAAIRRRHRTLMAADAAAYHGERFLHHREAFGPNLAGMLDEGIGTSSADYAAAVVGLYEARRTADDEFGPFDALIMPATNTTAPASLATTGDSGFQSPWSYAGVPAVSFPCGLIDGLPTALQLVARHDDDAALLAIAAWCERPFGVRRFIAAL